MTDSPNDVIEHYKSKIMEYKSERNDNCSVDKVVKYVLKQKSIEDVIRIAVRSRDEAGKMHPHQWRVQKIAYGIFINALLQVKEKIAKATDFDQLFSIVTIEGNKIWGVGEVLIYDTAFRIGKWRNINPQKIYLHAGTRKGVERLMGRKIRNDYIIKDNLKPPFNTCKLECWQLEDFFCIYKDIFSNDINKKDSGRKFCK